MTTQRCFPLTEELANPRWRNINERCKIQDAEILALQDLVLELEAKVRELEAVQAKLAESCLGYILLSLGQAEIINNTPSIDPPSVEELINEARRECGLDK